jgi:hypothetical protein
MAKRPPLIFQDDGALLGEGRNALLDQVKRMGGKGVQTDVIWGQVRKDGKYDLSKQDALVNAARERGLTVAMRLMGTPYYQEKSRPGIATELAATNPDPAVMQTFARDVARTFGGRVGRFGVWNEPNIDSFLMREAGNAHNAYRNLYDAAYRGVKEGNPNAKVGFGELTSGDPRDRGPESTLRFMRGVLAAKKKPLLADYMAIHPYQWSNPGKPPREMSEHFGGVSNLKGVQTALEQEFKRGRFATPDGKRRVPLVASEFGYKHDAQENRHTRAQWMGRALDEMGAAGVQSANLYQLMPSRQGQYWDSSILDQKGQLPQAFRRALRGRV